MLNTEFIDLAQLEVESGSGPMKSSTIKLRLELTNPSLVAIGTHVAS
jgi:hypothetical protein